MQHDIISKFSEHLKAALTRSFTLVMSSDGKKIEPEHLLWGLATQDGCVAAEILGRVTFPVDTLGELLGSTSVNPDVTTEKRALPVMTQAASALVEAAVLTANVYEHRFVGTEHLLSAMTHPKGPCKIGFFEENEVDVGQIQEHLKTAFLASMNISRNPHALMKMTQTPELALFEEEVRDERRDEEVETDDRETPALDYFADELTHPDMVDTFNPVIGRDREIRRVMHILSRRTKNNPILVGEPGVGKTAIVEGLARMIVSGDVPPVLMEKRIYRLDLASLIAGTMYRGEFESRLRQLIEEVAERPQVILFIDEVHTIAGTGSSSGTLDAANILKPALARGEIRCIGATTQMEYKKSIESDGALERRFGRVVVPEPSPSETRKILLGIQSYYEDFHLVNYTPEAIDAALRLSEAYFYDRHFPDKAIDVLDEAGAITNTKKRPSRRMKEIQRCKRLLEKARKTKEKAVHLRQYDDAKEIKECEKEILDALQQLYDMQEDEKPTTVDAPAVYHVVSEMLGIPAEHVQEQSLFTSEGLQSAFKAHLFGQDRAVKTVASQILRSQVGMRRKHRPLASFLFCGPTGTGKTSFAKVISDTIFPVNGGYLRLNMSEYSEGFSVSKLIGAPAGYVGYREKSRLTDVVKAQPHSVILFDEFEKAHPDVRSLLFQILDQGELVDATGRAISFRQAIIVMTTNVGADAIRGGGIGFSDGDAERGSDAGVRKALEDALSRPLLNRVDSVCVFNPPADEVIRAIVRKELEIVAGRLRDRDSELAFSDAAVEYISSQIDPKHGGHGVRRAIEDHVESQLTDLIISRGLSPLLTAKRSPEGDIVIEPCDQPPLAV